MPRAPTPTRPADQPQQPDRPYDENHLFRLLRSSHIFSSTVRDVLELKLLREITTLPLTLQQVQLIRFMALQGRHRVGDVAGYLGVSTAAASKNIEKLRRFGLLLRRRSEWDRRAKLLSVSPKGVRLIRRYEEHKNARLARTLQEFDTAEIDQLSGLLERFAVSLLETEPDTNGACLRCGGYLDDSCPVGHLRDGCPYLKGREARLGGAQ